MLSNCSWTIPEKKERNNFGRTAFMNACTKGHKDVVKLLLKYPKVVDIKIPDNFQISEEIQSLIDMHSMAASP